MDKKQRARYRILHHLQRQLLRYQGEHLEALRRANEAQRKTAVVIRLIMKLTADVARFS